MQLFRRQGAIGFPRDGASKFTGRLGLWAQLSHYLCPLSLFDFLRGFVFLLLLDFARLHSFVEGVSCFRQHSIDKQRFTLQKSW